MSLKVVDNREEVKVDRIRIGLGGGEAAPKSRPPNAPFRPRRQSSMAHGSLAKLCDATIRRTDVADAIWAVSGEGGMMRSGIHLGRTIAHRIRPPRRFAPPIDGGEEEPAARLAPSSPLLRGRGAEQSEEEWG